MAPENQAPPLSSAESERIPPGDLNFPLSQISSLPSHRRPGLNDFDFPHLRRTKKSILKLQP